MHSDKNMLYHFRVKPLVESGSPPTNQLSRTAGGTRKSKFDEGWSRVRVFRV